MNNDVALIPETAQALLNQATEYWRGVKEIKVSSTKEYDNALGVCKMLKTKINELEDTRKEIILPWDSKTRFVNKSFKEVRDSLESGEAVVKKAMSTWQRQEQLRIDEINRKLAAAAAEKARKEQEKAQAELAKAEAYRAKGREDLAEKAEARADTAIERSTTIVPEIKTVETKGKGASFTEFYECKVVNLAEFLAHSLSSPATSFLLSHVTVDIKAIERVQNAMKGALVIPGIEFTKQIRTSVRA